MKYYPDRWIIVTITSKDYGSISKVLASWYGGFGGSNSWKLSSGIVSFREDGDHYTFTNESGSEYVCHKQTNGMSAYTNSIYNGWEREAQEKGEYSILIESNYDRFQNLPNVAA